MDQEPSAEREVLLRTVDDPELVNTDSLVLSAAQISHRIEYHHPGYYNIFVVREVAEAADQELKDYEVENAHWPPELIVDSYMPLFQAMSLVVVGGLVYIYSQSGIWSQDGLWFVRGAGDSGAILEDGQYYRLVTALTLHADSVHLLGNCVLGGFLIHFFLAITGNGLGLAAILLSSSAANYINVLAHGPGHHFVGFSTAVFSVIGMLCTISFIGKTSKPSLHFFMPVMAGLAMLALLGSSGERTDLGGHFFGLACGLIFGNFARLDLFDKLRTSFNSQLISGVFSFFLVYFCWQLAFSS